MPNINVSYQEMAQQARELRAAEARLQDALQQIKSVMASSVQSGYQSSRQVEVAQNQHRQGAEEMLEGLKRMIRTLEQSADELQQSERRLNIQF